MAGGRRGTRVTVVSTTQRPTVRSRVWPAAAAVAVVLFVALFAMGATGPLTVVVPSLIAVAAVAFAFWAVRRAGAERAAYEDRLTRWAATEAVLAERLRIARDLHDIVSHGLGLITVRAAAARHLTAPADPQTDEMRADGTQTDDVPADDVPADHAPADHVPADHAPADHAPADDLRTALADIEKAGRQATAELRRMLTVLRAGDADAPREPPESISAVPAIVAAAGIAGLRTRLRLEDLGDVSQGAQVAVCRTVREALNNVARHAGPADVDVRIHRDGGAVSVSISDSGPDGRWPAAPGAGHGLTGLRERITALGGSFRAEPASGGFRVTARIPDEGNR